MTDRSQDQRMSDVEGPAQMSQAERDAYALQNSHLTIYKSFISLFGDRKDQQSLEAWLIEQLYQNFGGDPKKRIYEPWLEQQVLLPLLDGLEAGAATPEAVYREDQ